jgi:hypothetical protein
MKSNAQWASAAADDAVKAATIAHKAAKGAVGAKREIETRFPSEHEQMVQALASQEQGAFLRIGPKRNRWKDLAAYEEQLISIEQRRTALLEEIGGLNVELRNEPDRHTAELAEWLEAGSQGERPAPRASDLEHRVADLQAEYEALGLHYDKTLRERAEHVVKNRARFASDMRKAVANAEAAYRKGIDELEANRQELLDLRATHVWASLFPSELLANAPATSTLVGAKKAIQERHLPGVNFGLQALNVFALLRDDVTFCATVASVDQYAALEGVSTAALTGREAQWQEGKPDFVGPRFGATWAGSAEEAAEAEKTKRYAEAIRKRLWGN